MLQPTQVEVPELWQPVPLVCAVGVRWKILPPWVLFPDQSKGFADIFNPLLLLLCFKLGVEARAFSSICAVKDFFCSFRRFVFCCEPDQHAKSPHFIGSGRLQESLLRLQERYHHLHPGSIGQYRSILLFTVIFQFCSQISANHRAHCAMVQPILVCWGRRFLPGRRRTCRVPSLLRQCVLCFLPVLARVFPWFSRFSLSICFPTIRLCPLRPFRHRGISDENRSSHWNLFELIWTDRYEMTWYDMVSYHMFWHGMLWHGMAWYGMVWYDGTSESIQTRLIVCLDLVALQVKFTLKHMFLAASRLLTKHWQLASICSIYKYASYKQSQ